MADFDRRRFLKTSCAALAALPAAACIARPLAVRSPYASTIPDQSSGTIVNDVHSKLNRTHVDSIIRPESVEQLAGSSRSSHGPGQGCLHRRRPSRDGRTAVRRGGLLVDTRALNRIVSFDVERGHIAVEGGTQWPADHRPSESGADGGGPQWGIYQKQTGADRLSIGRRAGVQLSRAGSQLKPMSTGGSLRSDRR